MENEFAYWIMARRFRLQSLEETPSPTSQSYIPTRTISWCSNSKVNLAVIFKKFRKMVFSTNTFSPSRPQRQFTKNWTMKGGILLKENSVKFVLFFVENRFVSSMSKKNCLRTVCHTKMRNWQIMVSNVKSNRFSPTSSIVLWGYYLRKNLHCKYENRSYLFNNQKKSVNVKRNESCSCRRQIVFLRPKYYLFVRYLGLPTLQ